MTSITRAGLLGTRAVWFGVALAVAAQLLFTYTSPLQAVFGSWPIALADGAVVLGIGVALLLLPKVKKASGRGLRPKHGPPGRACDPPAW